jgi:hypothetical protein
VSGSESPQHEPHGLRRRRGLQGQAAVGTIHPTKKNANQQLASPQLSAAASEIWIQYAPQEPPGQAREPAMVRLGLTSGTVEVVRACEYFSEPGCRSSLGGKSFRDAQGDTGGGWVEIRDRMTSLEGTVSALCGAGFATDDDAVFVGFLDDLSMTAPIFVDGFESGDTTQWSVSVGE